MTDELRRVAFYLRVSSEEQRERGTIENQRVALQEFFGRQEGVVLTGVYEDNGVSGTIALSERPGGRRLLADARRGKISEVWVVRADRLGRDAADMLAVWKTFKELRVKLVGVEHSIESYLTYGIQALVADDEHETILARSAAGMARAAREGRYCGGIVPLGFMLDGKRPHSRLIPSDVPMWRSWAEADLVRQIYGWLVEGWSCIRIADHLNGLGVPTVYAKDGRLVGGPGKRKQRTQNKWRPGRIRNLVVNPVYKGEYHYGRRTKKDRDVIVASVPPLVPVEVWEAAQRTLARHNYWIRGGAKRRVYLLRSLMRCGICGLNFSGMLSRGVVWYRCNGQISYRGKLLGRCVAKGIRGPDIEGVIWSDVEHFLLDPGYVIEELAAQQRETSGAALREAELHLLEEALGSIPTQRDRMLEAYRRGSVEIDEFERQMEAIARDERELKQRREQLVPAEALRDDAPGDELLAELRRRVQEGLDEEQRREIVALLVRRITVNSERGEDGKKRAEIVVEYRFAAVVDDYMGRGSWHRRA